MFEMNSRMTPRQRDIVFKVADGNLDTLPILFNFMNYKRCDEILQWLLDNNFKGRNLIALVNREFSNQLLSTVKFILMKVDKETIMRPLFLGKDYS